MFQDELECVAHSTSDLFKLQDICQTLGALGRGSEAMASRAKQQESITGERNHHEPV